MIKRIMKQLSRWGKMKVLIVDPVHEYAIEKLKERFDVVYKLQPPEEEFVELISDADVLVVRSGVKVPAELIDKASKLKLIARAGAGVDNIDIDAATKKGITVFNIPSISAVSVAELTFGLTFGIARKICLADRWLRDDQWRKKDLYGHQVSGKTIGIVGLGKIGLEVVKIAKGFGMKVLGARKNSDVGVEGVEVVDLDKLLAESDFVCLHVPYNESTKSLIGADEISKMKKTAFLINMSRGGVVNEDDLYNALKEDVIAGAATDVFKTERVRSKLFDLDNVVVTPHIGAMTFDSQKEIAIKLCANIFNFIDNKGVENKLN